MSSRYLSGCFWVALLVARACACARAQEQTHVYAVSGSDVFRSAARDVQSVTKYVGHETLTMSPAVLGTRFHVKVRYSKTGSRLTNDAEYFLGMARDGAIFETEDRDPDYLAILNQPFSIQLDAPTMRDLRALEREIPFDFPSPMTGAPLHGSLRRLTEGSLAGHRVLGIAFAAAGPLRGSVPDRPGLDLIGRITMNGTAYYAETSALLLALEATLSIEGKVADPGGSDTVTIVYKRSIRPGP